MFLISLANELTFKDVNSDDDLNKDYKSSFSEYGDSDFDNQQSGDGFGSGKASDSNDPNNYKI